MEVGHSGVANLSKRVNTTATLRLHDQLTKVRHGELAPREQRIHDIAVGIHVIECGGRRAGSQEDLERVVPLFAPIARSVGEGESGIWLNGGRRCRRINDSCDEALDGCNCGRRDGGCSKSSQSQGSECEELHVVNELVGE